MTRSAAVPATKLFRKNGNDSLVGDAGDDWLYGDYETLSGSEGGDTMDGSAGTDTVDYSVRTSSVTDLSGGNGGDVMYGGDGELDQRHNDHFAGRVVGPVAGEGAPGEFCRTVIRIKVSTAR